MASSHRVFVAEVDSIDCGKIGLETASEQLFGFYSILFYFLDDCGRNQPG